ncbi:MAG TPA: DUF1080 domain-containing protein [Blastocatellia bacterium]|nr:DUF1080 domain-containing protein [Blastocatellia bacterium]
MLKGTIGGVLCMAISSGLMINAHGTPRSQRRADSVGRWDVTVKDASGTEYPSWFEITREGDKLIGRFVGRTGSQRPIKSIEFVNRTLTFSLPPQYERRKDDLRFEGKLTGRRIEGTISDAEGKPLRWTAVRAPKLRRKAPRWGNPVSLFNGRDLTGWRLRNSKLADAWKVVDGVMQNAPRSTDIISKRKFKDFKLHVEFKMIEKSNSGVYLRGRYEVQIEDNYGMEPGSLRIGGIYGFITPSSNPSKKPGEWQSYDITLIGRRVTVVLNGTKIIDAAEIPGITGGALDSKEREAGPIMLQGDHTQIYYRNIVITPVRDR